MDKATLFMDLSGLYMCSELSYTLVNQEVNIFLYLQPI